MRVLFSLLAVLAIAMPSMAAVTIDVAVVDNVATVSYSADTAEEVPCAFSLDIIPGTGAVIDSVATGAATDDSFNVFLDAASSSTSGYLIGAGTPWADVSAAGEITDFSAGFCYSAAYLQNDNTEDGDLNVEPGLTGVLFTVTGTGDFTIATNNIRGGVVKAASADPAITPDFTVNDLTGAAFTLEEASAACPYDLSGDGWISTDDITSLVNYLTPYADAYYWVQCDGTNDQYDLSGDGWISTDDITSLVNFLTPYADAYYWVQCP